MGYRPFNKKNKKHNPNALSLDSEIHDYEKQRILTNIHLTEGERREALQRLDDHENPFMRDVIARQKQAQIEERLGREAARRDLKKRLAELR